MLEVREATIDSVRSAILSGQYTCRDIVTAFVARIELYNGTLNTLTCLNPSALDEADALDAALRAGTQVGPLLGVPILIKDNYDVRGLPTTASCAALRTNYRDTEGPVVRALREAGAVILGKTNMSELALEGLSVSSLVGQTLNPYDLTRTPGGSSGGTAAAVAASFAVFGLGTDTVNSLRSPASACSLYSFKPTRGLISRVGVVPVSDTQDTIGAIGRSLDDIAIALNVMASVGRDEQDPATIVLPSQPIGTDYQAALLEPLSIPALRVGVMKSFCGVSNSGSGDPVALAVSRTLNCLQDMGVEVVAIDDAITWDTQTLLGLDVQVWEFREGLDSYLATSTGNGLRSMADLYSSTRNGKDFLVIPYLYQFLNKVLKGSKTDPEYAARLKSIDKVTSALQNTFTSLRLDAIVYPEQRNLVVPVGAPNQYGRNGILAAVTGFPVVTIPIGFSEATETAHIGVPIGLEILGLAWTESKLLRIAQAIESHQGCARKAPQLLRLDEEVTAVSSYKVMPKITLDPTTNINDAYPLGVVESS